VFRINGCHGAPWSGKTFEAARIEIVWFGLSAPSDIVTTVILKVLFVEVLFVPSFGS
jgi:hypothetical protein